MKKAKITGLVEAFASASDIDEFVLFIWYNPWALVVVYNFGLW